MVAKYSPLKDYLLHTPKAEVLLGFHRIEEIIEDKLPSAALEYREWWANENPEVTRHVHSKSWTEAGWMVEKVDLDGEAVMFRRRNAK